MAMRWGLGPVFAFESLIAVRRWQAYAWRTFYVSLLLAGLALTWGPWDRQLESFEDAAEIGRVFLLTIIAVQLGVVLLAAPAATAGAICVDKSRGTLLHAFVTDLSAREIIVGKLGARLIPVLSLMAYGLPVLALGSFLGGIDMAEAIGAELVTAGVAVVCCTLALLTSVWARKPHQSLLLAYTLVGVWLGLVPGLIWLAGWGPPTTTEYLVFCLSNPVIAAFASEVPALRSVGLVAQVVFFSCSLVVATALVAIASGGLRQTVLAQANRPVRREQPDAPGRIMEYLPGPPLDSNPVLWREWHRKRPSRWTGRFWTAYAVISGAASLYVIGTYYGLWGQGIISSGVHAVAAQVNAWQAAIGLLLLSVSAATTLAEERDRGSLDVIMTTTLTTREIVWGKWWGTFAMIPRLAILPIWIAIGAAMITDGWPGAVLMIGLILSYAAAIVSIGLALATWVPRLGRVITASVMAYLAVTVGWPLILDVFSRLWVVDITRDTLVGLALASPYFGIYATTEWAAHWSQGGGWREIALANYDPTWPLIWIGVNLAIALLLAWATVRTFDRCLGRIPESGSVPALAR